MIGHLRIALAVMALAFGALLPVQPTNAQTPSQFFNFVTPWDDSTANDTTDMSFLNTKPAGVNGFIFVRGGHFIEAKTGNRVRFLGTNFTFANDFPAHSDAEKIAAHLAKLGINIVRIHHHDADYGMLWDKRFPDHQHFDPAAIDRLDYLIYQLKLNGIYVDLNLHVSRQFTPEDGFPASVDDIPTGYDKRVDYYDSRMIALQKKFAHDYLTHVNPYTHLSYALDPCVAIIEINNENSLVGDPWTTMGAGLDTMPEPFEGELLAKWTTWLKRRYGTDMALRKAWSRSSEPPGPELLGSLQWQLEHTLNASLTTPMASYTTSGYSPQPADIKIPQSDGVDWHVQAKLSGLTLVSGKTYSLSFYARADTSRKIGISTTLDESDWHNVGLYDSVNVGTTGKKYVLVFTASNAVAGHNRVAFQLGDKTGEVWISDVTLHSGTDPSLLFDIGTLIHGISYPDTPTIAENTDWVNFLSDQEVAYVNTMRSYLVNTLHVHANIIGSQISWAGSAGMIREQDSPFADNHAYWHHPSFPHRQWDYADWNIENSPMTTDLANGGGGTLESLAEYRVAGKPYTISEYNEPAPSDYRSECVPILASFAAAQDWDGIFLFDWGNYGAQLGDQNSMVQSFFSTGSDPARAGFFPAAAMIFREQPDVSRLPDTYTLHESYADAKSAAKIDDLWHRNGIVPDIFKHALAATVVTNYNGASVSVSPASISNNGTYAKIAVSKPGTYTYLSPHAWVASGYLGGSKISVGPVTIDTQPFGNNFCTVTVTQRTPRSFLVSVVGKVENHDMGWDANRTTVEDKSGAAPSQAEFVPATISMDLGKLIQPRVTTVSVESLDSTGKPWNSMAANLIGSTVSFDTSADQKTIWYLVQVERVHYRR